MSCATNAARIALPPETELPVSAPPVETIPSPLALATYRIKQNSPDIKKYYTIDESGDIIVKAEPIEIRQEAGKAERFEAVYDLKQLQVEETGGFWVPFTVKSLDAGEVQEDALLWKPQKDPAGILLSFDDDYTDDWERNFDLFDRYNARVTFFIQGKYCSFCTAALERGHDVGYHTLSHLNLPKVSRETFSQETRSQTAIFRSAGVPLSSFAYPFGFFESWMHEELFKSFRILRGYNTGFQAYDPAAIADNVIFSRAIDNIVFKRDDDFTAAITIMFRTVKFIGRGLILPLTTHAISDNADWGIKPHRLQYLLQTANDLQLTFYRFSDFY